MTARDVTHASLGFAGLGLTVAINLLVLQERQASQIETSALASRPMSASDITVRSSDGDLARIPPTGTAPMLAGPPRVASAPMAAGSGAAQLTSNGAEITRGIQRELNTRGYDAGPPDGVAGLVTRAAIMAYEHDFGLPLTATPNQDLLSRIVLGSAAGQASRPSLAAIAEAEAVVRSVEQQLAALGYAPGRVDGKLDDVSARAIREFELDQKLPESGRISGPLVSRLIRLQGQGGAPAHAKTKSAQK